VKSSKKKCSCLVLIIERLFPAVVYCGSLAHMSARAKAFPNCEFSVADWFRVLNLARMLIFFKFILKFNRRYSFSGSRRTKMSNFVNPDNLSV
jgi:hypothetical protein